MCDVHRLERFPPASSRGLRTPDPATWDDSLVDITLQYFDGCPNWKVAQDRLREVLPPGAEVTYERVETFEDAQRLVFRGSPTVLIDGRDPFAADAPEIGLSCRVYQTDAGLEGAPSVVQLRSALGG
jgi:hypothetical protein